MKGQRLRGQVLVAWREMAEVEAALSIALKTALEVKNPKQLWRTYEALGDLHSRQDRPDRAREAYQSALAIIEEVAAGLDEPNQREILLNSAAVGTLSRKLGRFPDN